jgi:hypothetical protein
MIMRFQELDWRSTPLGELVSRRRWDPLVDRVVHALNRRWSPSWKKYRDRGRSAPRVLIGPRYLSNFSMYGSSASYTPSRKLEDSHQRAGQLDVTAVAEVRKEEEQVRPDRTERRKVRMVDDPLR